MRIAFTSDLHSDLCRRNDETIDAIARRATELAPDLFVVAGDVAETLDGVSRTLERLSDVGARRCYLPGNHDLFVEGDPARPGTATSRDKYERLLPDVAARAGFEALGMQAVRNGRLAVVAVTGWYDFTLRDLGADGAIGVDAYRAGQWRGTRAYDRGHVYWPRPRSRDVAGQHPSSVGGAWAGDEEICAYMLERLDAQLETVRDVTAVVAVVHVVPFVGAVVRRAFGASAFFDAYLGSARIGERLRAERRLRGVIHGHQHRVTEHRLGGVPVVARPLGDARKSPLAPTALARERIGVLELDVD